MIKEIGSINGIPLYENEYMEEGEIIKGKKGTFLPNLKTNFIIVHPKTAKIILQGILIKERKEKLEKLNSII